MTTKETIHKRILQYINLIWETDNINNLNPLVRLMIEATDNELLLLNNKLNSMNSDVSERLVERILPKVFNYIRPSHSILLIEPVNDYKVEKHVSFNIKTVPNDIKLKNITSVSFTPVVTTDIYDINISHMFCNKSMWTINKHEVELFGTTNERAQYNKIWLGLRVNADRKNLQDIAFYLDFKDLPDHHKYYSMMSELEWQLDEKPLNIKSGFSSAYTSGLAKSEREILDFYKDHYQTLVGKVDLKEEDKKKVPTELEQVIGDEMILPTTPMHWISIKFPSRFKHEDVEKISIFLNAVPVINREYNKQSIRRQELDNTVSLASGVGEQFLEIDSISDSRGNLYENSDSLEKEGTYTIESIERQNSGTPIITDSLERLADMVQDKRTAFPNMDYEKIVSVLSSLTSITNNDDVKSESNRLRDYADVALFNANPATNASTLNAHFWTSYADLVNGIEAGTSLMANKIHELNKIDAILLTPSSGGRNFYTPKSLKAISNFYLGSKNRILTKHNILNFCWAEFAEYLERVDVVRKASVGSSLKEGIIIVMEIQLQPKSDCNWYFEQKSTLKDFIVRLYRISPNNFNYQILIL